MKTVFVVAGGLVALTFVSSRNHVMFSQRDPMSVESQRAGFTWRRNAGGST